MSAIVHVARAMVFACFVSMLAAATVNVLYGADRVPPVWVDNWFAGSVIVGACAVAVVVAAQVLSGAPG